MKNSLSDIHMNFITIRSKLLDMQDQLQAKKTLILQRVNIDICQKIAH